MKQDTAPVTHGKSPRKMLVDSVARLVAQSWMRDNARRERHQDDQTSSKE